MDKNQTKNILSKILFESNNSHSISKVTEMNDNKDELEYENYTEIMLENYEEKRKEETKKNMSDYIEWCNS